MINILTPMASANLYQTSSDSIYPNLLLEVNNKTLFEFSQQVYSTLHEDKKRIYVIPEDKINEFNLASIINLISENENVIVPLHGETKGAVCSCLMAIDHISLDDELIIASADHYLDEDLDEVVGYFREQNADAGVLSFNSVHPKWSYIQLDDKNRIIQTAEKVAISKHAIAGFFYFKKGRDFVEAAKEQIRKDEQINGKFYLSSCLNEMILLGKKIAYKQLTDNVYHNFYDTHSINIFVNNCSRQDIRKLTDNYIQSFNRKRLADIIGMLHNDVILVDPENDIQGINNASKMLENLFSSVNDLSFFAKNVFIENKTSIIEFELKLDQKLCRGIDVINWSDNKIKSLNAYLY
jgi:dTDP-glucose pyrophosphorylase